MIDEQSLTQSFCICGSSARIIEYDKDEYDRMSWSCTCKKCGTAITEANNLIELIANWNSFIDRLSKEKLKAQIKSCPFCGNDVHYDPRDNIIECKKCSIVAYSNREKIIDLWNKRS